MTLFEGFDLARRSRRARPPKLPNWKGRATIVSRPFFPPTATFTGKVRAPKGYAFNGRGDLVSLKRIERRHRTAVRAVEKF